MKRTLLFLLSWLIVLPAAAENFRLGVVPVNWVANTPTVYGEYRMDKDFGVGAYLMNSNGQNTFTPYAKSYFTGNMQNLFAGVGLNFLQGAQATMNVEFGYEWLLYGTVQEMSLMSNSAAGGTSLFYRLGWPF